MKEKVYLASPFFDEKQKALKSIIKNKLQTLNFNVIDPQEPSDKSSWELSNAFWGEATFSKDINKIEKSDLVVAIDWGLYSDTGTAWEVGYAYAKDIPVLVICPNEALNQVHSLMVVNGSDNFISEERFLSIQENIEFQYLMGKTYSYFLNGVEQK